MSNSPSGGRESPSSTASSTTASGSGSVIGSLGSGSNGCRNSGASFDSGRATASSTTFIQGVRYSAGGLSSESSLGSFRHSYHSSNSSLGSIPSEEIRNFDVAAMISQGVPDHEILNAWLTGIHLECYYQNFIQAGYDMHTISRMTPEDLNAIGVTKPHHRKKIKSEISQLNISEGLPDYIPDSVEDWLRLLKLEEYLPRLLDQGYRNVRQVTNITWEDLDDIGILKLGHQKKFMLAVKRIQDILSGKRLPAAYVPNAYTTPLENFPLSQQPQLKHLTSSMPYPQSSPIVNNSQECQYQSPSMIDPRHQIQRNVWSQQSYQQQQAPLAPPGAISHQIQVHHPPGHQLPNNTLHDRMPLGNPLNSVTNNSSQVQPLYHPEVISIRVKNGHGNNSLDSPPEEEPIYGTSSFLRNPSSPAPNAAWLASRGTQQSFKSFEEGETPSTSAPPHQTNGYAVHNGSNLSLKQSMSNTWTLPRLQKNKPISKVMGGGINSSNCDSSSVTYPINPGPFAPQQLNPPVAPPPHSSFNKVDYAVIKSQPPPPPRRSSCSSLGPSQLDENNLPLLPPPPLPPNTTASVEVNSIAHNQSQNNNFANQNIKPYTNYGMSASYYGQRSTNPSSSNTNNHQIHNTSLSKNALTNGAIIGGGRSTLPKSRDPSPAGSDLSDPDLPSNNGFLSKGVRRNGSDASFKSNSSTESESIPFANDNAGTIKQQKPSQQRLQQGNGDGSGSQENEGADVLSDIGSMLADLTDQLDAILEQERTSKR